MCIETLHQLADCLPTYSCLFACFCPRHTCCHSEQAFCPFHPIYSFTRGFDHPLEFLSLSLGDVA
jgi:hypothetical protein